MKFLDEVEIYAASGKGGDGAVSFRREAHVPRGGPDGGDGGKGGSVVFEATRRRNTLIDYRRYRHQRADDGVPGGKRRMNGARGRDKFCPVPIGTIIYDAETGEQLADLDEPGAQWILPGGDGGLGNVHYKSSTNRTPRFAKKGFPGREIKLRLELKLLANLGLLGFPNAGKSTFLSKVTAAKPRIADYPFTTITPNLGVVRLGDRESFVIADIPGLIEGAAEGAGLGHAFLKHVERCGAYIHLVAPSLFDGEESELDRFHALNAELKKYGSGLYSRPQLIVLTKTDLLSEEELESRKVALKAATGCKVFSISSVSGDGLTQLLRACWILLKKTGVVSEEEDVRH